MKYKKLGKSGIKVSEIGFGAWTIALNSMEFEDQIGIIQFMGELLLRHCGIQI